MRRKVAKAMTADAPQFRVKSWIRCDGAEMWIVQIAEYADEQFGIFRYFATLPTREEAVECGRWYCKTHSPNASREFGRWYAQTCTEKRQESA